MRAGTLAKLADLVAPGGYHPAPEASARLETVNDQIASWALNWARGEESVIAQGKLLTYTPSATGGSNVDDMSILAKLKA